ncbi:MAG: hypothetical protein GEV09_00760 [Pseudonocardiaceae bacterium]|nr:hypothetical protein [Pseudonocardiaceae bacterium]
MHDIASLEGQGVVGAFVASTEFVEGARAQSQALGYGDGGVPAVFVAHPIQDRTDDEMRALADAALDDVLAAVTSSRS